MQRLVTAALRERIGDVLRDQGVLGEVRRVARVERGELVLVVRPDFASQASEADLGAALRRLLPGPVRVAFDGPAWQGRTEPLLAE